MNNNSPKPNIILINADDLGYGDLGCYGSLKNKTPNLDRMAEEGVRFMGFYGCPYCTPSRASLMTGCYAMRVGLPAVLGPEAGIGLSGNEITIADCLKSAGYATGIVGKWHLGHQAEFLPTSHGFDSYFGLPYSNDMLMDVKMLPLMKDDKVLEWASDQKKFQSTITERYTEESVRFITENKDRPFFLYLAHMDVHMPHHPSEEALAESGNGVYGAVVGNIDRSAGKIFAALKDLGLEENTVVIFTSDNGAEIAHPKAQGASNAPLRAGKGTSYEGGIRVPFIAKWPGRFPAGQVNSEMSAMMDILPTACALAGAEVPSDRIIDGKNILPLMKCEQGAKSGHEALYIYRVKELQAVRSGKWKLYTKENTLFDLDNDIGETTDVYAENPGVADMLSSYADTAREELGDGVTPGSKVRPAGSVANPKNLYELYGRSAITAAETD